MSFYRQQLEDWLKELDVDADYVLDMGGKEKPVKGRTKSWNVKEYRILDLPEFDIESTYDFPKSWELVFCLEVFEYLINPIQAMKNISDALLEGGTAYATFAFVYPHHNQLQWDSLRYTESGIVRLAEKAHLQVEKMWYRTDKSGYLQKLYQADGMKAAKQYNHHDATGFIVEFQK